MYERNMIEVSPNVAILRIYTKLPITRYETKDASKPLKLNMLKKRENYLSIFYAENVINSLSHNKMPKEYTSQMYEKVL